ncbi:MAG: hypothetical protein ACIAS6_08280 [Phycisphaerales bacterium JB060]
MRDDTNQAPHRDRHHPPLQAMGVSQASLQEKLRRGEIGGQALGLIQLVAAQRAGSDVAGEPGNRRLAELN